ncbi:MAG: energy transducer TonB [candidate division WOR-3 bacterium]|nr:energy transducer TonB [candidate division WOR-3 bacterium]
MIALILLTILGSDKDSTRELIPYLAGDQGSGFILWGDAEADALITRIFPAVTEAMKADTSKTFRAVASIEIDRSGAIVKEPELLEKSKVPKWDTTIITTLRGWLFETSRDSLRRDTVEFRYIARKSGKGSTSIIKAKGREDFHPAAFTSVDKILADQSKMNAPRDSIMPMGINVTFSGDLGLDDLESHIMPDLEESMNEKGIAYVTARFEIVVNDKGTIDDVRVIQSSGRTAWDSELEKAMLQWRFKPSYRLQRKTDVIFVVSLE